ncbi:DUF881 domain-containing protein [Calidifontibacter sp. DB0510]|uniref:DUF881 domain-containing protein n=1 Tax=Metallococcus carri TaxID=1656884 RepID=A0A967E803_9MICO|nr:DUF881 domain-containing protein [Metallococcus carri]NHN54707.1 DUF881 domain-containing protein [Metallococcus carri]NOP37052.1 DUF881 domain-containing protein [Calidifontibacter sp. DB2511S]
MTTRPARDPAASMSLITELMRNPLDPSYEDVARRKRAQGKATGGSLHSPLLVVTTLLIGFALAVAATALRVPKNQAQKDHDAIISRVEAGQATIDKNTRTITGLRKEIDARQNAALTGSDLPQRITTLETETGAGAVTGPGWQLTIDDAPSSSTDGQGDPRTSTSSQGRVTSSDLQVVVNGLWHSGAEAIAINGQRLGATTAIRFAGEAILVNFRPLVPPYVISVVGPSTLQSSFSSGTGGIYLDGLVQGFGVRRSMTAAPSLRLPALPSIELNYAKPTKEAP